MTNQAIIENSRLDKIISSVSDMLLTNKLRKEFNLLTSLKDLELYIDNDFLLQNIKDRLSDGISMDEIKQQLHIPIMLLHECPITANNTKAMSDYIEDIKKEHYDITRRFIKN